jgi:alkylation response protein AidB-like acyl-CoA dehydrogenase
VDVRLSDEQEMLRSSVREFLDRECPLAETRGRAERGDPFPSSLWKRMAELGWPGLAVAETYGGAGLGPLELAVVAEEMGRSLCGAPFLSSAALGASALGRDASAHANLLRGIADGSRIVALALYDEAESWDPERVALDARGDADRFVLSGRKLYVADAGNADVFLVAARGPDAAATLLCVEATAPGVSLRRVAWQDLTRPVWELSLDEVRLPGAARVGHDDGPLRHALAVGRAVLAAEMTGAAAQALDLTVTFAGQREQFGKPIGSFQAIQHRCADMFLLVEGARSAAYYAAWALHADEPDADVAASMAKAYASEAFTRVAGHAIQIHGGLGFTWEQDLHLYYKRAKADEAWLGSPAFQRERIAAALF